MKVLVPKGYSVGLAASLDGGGVGGTDGLDDLILKVVDGLPLVVKVAVKVVIDLGTAGPGARVVIVIGVGFVIVTIVNEVTATGMVAG